MKSWTKVSRVTFNQVTCFKSHLQGADFRLGLEYFAGGHVFQHSVSADVHNLDAERAASPRIGIPGNYKVS